MSQESVHDKNFLEFVKTSEPVKEEAEGIEGIKGEMLGSKARYRFTCQSCSETEVTTEEAYTAEEGSLARGMRRRALYTLMYKLRSHLFSIPYVGTVFRDLLPSTSTLDNYTRGQGMKKGKLAAFEEIKDKFHRCESCGSYVCTSCYRNGRCVDCSGSKE